MCGFGMISPRPPPQRGAPRAQSGRRSVPSVVERDRLVEQVDVAVDLRLARVTVDADLGEDPLGDLDHDLGVLREKGLGVLAALTELLALACEPRAGLLHQPEIDT